MTYVEILVLASTLILVGVLSGILTIEVHQWRHSEWRSKRRPHGRE